jgi:hypothetical protein
MEPETLRSSRARFRDEAGHARVPPTSRCAGRGHRIVVTSAERGDQGDTIMSTHPKASHHTHLARGSVAENLARIEFTPDDLERLKLCWPSRWSRRGEVFHAGPRSC